MNSGFAQAAGSLVGSLIDAHSAKDAQAAAAEASNQQMLFQERMSNTAYQRQVEDLKAAGINPMLVSKLGGASSPPGAQPSIIVPQLGSSFSKFASGLSSAAQAEQLDIQGGLTKAQTKQVEAATDKIREEIKNIPTEGERLRQAVFQLAAQENLYRQQSYTEQERQRMLAQTVKKLIEETKVISAEASAIESLDNLGREYGQLKPLIDTIIGVMKGLK